MTGPPHVVGHGRFGDFVSQQTQLGMDAWRAPCRVVTGHAANEGTNFLVERRTTRLVRAGLPTPVQAKALLVPANGSFRFDDDERGSPIDPPLRQTNPEQPIPT